MPSSSCSARRPPPTTSSSSPTSSPRLAGGPHGHRRAIVDRDGGRDTLNAATLRAASSIDLATDRAVVDGVRLRLSGIENAVGGDGADRLVGNAGRNRLDGGRGDDLLRGGGGADLLGDGPGRDLLAGGRGRDVFELAADGKPDAVRDFQDGIDRLRLSDAAFRDLRFRDRDDGSMLIVHAGDRLLVEAARGDLDRHDFSAADFLLGLIRVVLRERSPAHDSRTFTPPAPPAPDSAGRA